MLKNLQNLLLILLSDPTTCTSRDNARALRPVLRGAGGANPPLPTRHFHPGIIRYHCTPKIPLVVKLTALIMILAIILSHQNHRTKLPGSPATKGNASDANGFLTTI
jgi:hypothetical protein